jgi:hypothetical protein
MGPFALLVVAGCIIAPAGRRVILKVITEKSIFRRSELARERSLALDIIQIERAGFN